MAKLNEETIREGIDEEQIRERIEEETIRERAYFLWLNEGRPDDRHIDHWLRAAGESAPSTSEGA